MFPHPEGAAPGGRGVRTKRLGPWGSDGACGDRIAPVLKDLFRKYPVVTINGPRQSGKTTLARSVFPDLPYVNLEAPDIRTYAQEDPRGFLGGYADGAILDEIQRVSDLLSYIQPLVDEKGRNGLFVLTGSQHFGLSEAIGQSLAGRTAPGGPKPHGVPEVRAALRRPHGPASQPAEPGQRCRRISHHGPVLTWDPGGLVALEAKAGETLNQGVLGGFPKLRKTLGDRVLAEVLIYGGPLSGERESVRFTPVEELADTLDDLDGELS